MALEDNARNLYLDGTRLYGDTKEDGFWRTQSTIDLDSILGNNDGDFQLGGSKFSGSAQNIRLEGSKLRAKLTKRDRKSGVEAILDLATVLRVINGMFVFISKERKEHDMSIKNGGGELQEYIRDFAANAKNLRIDVTQLSGDTKKTNGTWTCDTIDLRFKLGNDNGRFYTDGTNFADNAGHIGVDGTTLVAQLKNSQDTYDEAFLELAAVLKVVDGIFFFRSEYEIRNYTSTPATSLADNSRNLHITNIHWLSGETKKNGSWTTDSIDLTSKIANRDGEFDFRGDRDAGFDNTATEIRVEGATLRALLEKAAGYYHVDASLDLGLILKVVNGKFDFIPYERRPSPSDFDGPGLVANSRNLYVKGGRLQGETKKSGSWISDYIDLGRYLGNDKGRFNLDQRRFTWSASEFKLKGTTLLASLNNGNSWPSEASLDLSLVLNVDKNGKFVFITEHQRKRIVSSVFFMFVEKNGEKVELHGLCLNKYGKLEASSIDLNNYYKSDGSESLASDYYDGGSRNLANRAQDFSLEVTSAEVLLHAKLRDGWNASVNLNINIENRDGKFHFEKHDGRFDLDGAVTKFFEGSPVVDYFVALVDLFKGNNEWAERATALATNSTFVFVAITIGSIIGAPPGAALVAGIATPIGIAAEVEIRKTVAEDLRIEFEDATVGRHIYETLRNMLAAGAAAKFAKWVEKQSPGAFSAASKALDKTLNFSTRKAGGKAVDASVQKILDALIQDQLPREWLEVEEKVKRL